LIEEQVRAAGQHARHAGDRGIDVHARRLRQLVLRLTDRLVGRDAREGLELHRQDRVGPGEVDAHAAAQERAREDLGLLHIGTVDQRVAVVHTPRVGITRRAHEVKDRPRLKVSHQRGAVAEDQLLRLAVGGKVGEDGGLPVHLLVDENSLERHRAQNARDSRLRALCAVALAGHDNQETATGQDIRALREDGRGDGISAGGDAEVHTDLVVALIDLVLLTASPALRRLLAEEGNSAHVRQRELCARRDEGDVDDVVQSEILVRGHLSFSPRG
jgi:hypothetical protein